ncbi:Ibr domain protein (macronuclear) [Tetrahymena thermophila SB210]|uniref:Ibr domain protein n=1 Tax=Tetrahymena thermophila (strain SB210) TaxID=312017 RepID=Q23F31_TETTS|nr:Ibr domain protein [Tetrahymena thermophila SB210]EAR95074.1 Ibr domain protein [Tetrahymena thermophila SB210]|eukprot:XP_001015319.1 Ibr domain protein [Tetrahymena thermophila SB210]
MRFIKAIILIVYYIYKFLLQKAKDLAVNLTSKSFSCLVCYQTTDKQNKFCLFCNICYSCLDSWFAQQIKTQIENLQDNSNQPNLYCPRCKRSFSQEKILQNQDKFKKTMIQISELFIKKSDLFIKCASKKCQNVGWVDNQNCQDQFDCPSCDLKWIADKGQTVFQKFSLLFSFKELKSKLYKAIFAKTCPHCNIYIIKNGGCNNMTCKNCGKGFCWYCKLKYQHPFTLFCFIFNLARLASCFIFPFVEIIQFISKISKQLISDFAEPIYLTPLSIKLAFFYFQTQSISLFEKSLNLITSIKRKPIPVQ